MPDPGANVQQTVPGSGNIFSGTGNVTVTTITDDKAYDVAGLPNPYLGLRSFTYAERTRYAGRERSVEEAMAKLVTPGEQRALLFITGASGSGKSSFTQAGLLPALEAYYAQRGQPVQHAVFRPGLHPIAACDETLKQLRTGAAGSAIQPVRIVVVDQFEESFTQSQPEERSLLFSWLAELPPFALEQQHVIVTVRSDYLDELFEVKPLWECAKQGLELRAMQAQELKDAIQCPLQSQYPHGEKRLEPDLVDRLAQDAAGDATYLPLLQVTLDALWVKGRLVLSNYGTLTDAIKQRADQVYQFIDFDSANPVQPRSQTDQDTILELFLSLVNVSPDDDARRDVRISRVTTMLTADQRRLMLDISRARLLSVDEQANIETVNIIHETLIRNWDRLREAVRARRQRLRLRGRFEQQLQLWLANDCSDDYLLLTHVQLAEARDLELAGDIALREGRAPELLHRSVEFDEAEHQRELDEARKLAESERMRAEEQEQANRRMQARNRVLTFVGALALSAAVVAGLLGYQAYENLYEAQHQARLARARELTAAAVSNLDFDPDRSILLALEAVTTTYALENKSAVPEAEGALHSAIEAARFRLDLTGHADVVWAIAFSPDGKLLATASQDRTAKVWEVSTGQELRTLTGHTDAVTAIAFSPDGTLLATASQDHTAKVWEVSTGQELRTLTGHTDSVNAIAFSPDGILLATASQDHTAKVWEASTGKNLRTLTGHSDALSGIAFSPDGTLLATASQDHTAKVWEVSTGKDLRTLAGHSDALTGIAFSPDGTLLATASKDHTAKVWGANTGLDLRTLAGHTEAVTGISFSPDSQRLATASSDNTAKVWEVETAQKLFTLSGHSGPLFSVSFSPDGKLLATSSSDHSAKVWDAATNNELLMLTDNSSFFTFSSGRKAPVTAVVTFSPNGKLLATARLDHTAKVWDAITGTEVVTLTGHTDAVAGITFSHDGTLLATASYDKTAKVWNASTGEVLRTLTGHKGIVYAVAFSPDGKLLATASQDHTAIVWEVSTGKALLTLIGHKDSIFAIAFSPDGLRLATASGDNTAKGWDVNTGQELFTWKGIGSAVFGITFSPDGSRLAAASGDKTARVLDVKTGKVLILSNHVERVVGVSFSPDGKRLATASWDRTAKVWDAKTGNELFTLSGHTDRVLAVTYNADGSRLATASIDGTVRIYAGSIEELIRLAHSRLARTWTPEECKKYLQSITCPSTP